MDEQQIETGWAILELMGHKVVAGQYTWDGVTGSSPIRMDVPKTEGFEAYTQIFGRSALYCLTPVSEEIARRAAEKYRVNPVQIYGPELVTVEQAKKLQEGLEKARNENYRLRAGLPAPRYPNNDQQDDGSDNDERLHGDD